MSTAAFDASGAIDARMAELLELVKQAKQIDGTNDAARDAICRSCCVMLSSHIEGGITDFCTSAVRDFNYFVNKFSDMPTQLKRSFCQKLAYYEGVPERSINSRVDQLILFFDANSVPIDMEAISYIETPYKNPKPSSIDKPFEKVGVPGVMDALGSEFLLQAFSGNEGKRYLTLRKLKSFRANLFHFPYKKLDSNIFADAKAKKGKKAENMWHTFLEEVVSRRNSIAHGKTIENPTTISSLEEDIFKAEVFLRASCTYFFSSIKS
ncbi:HEPN domain-containing protein [Mameliella alba]|uniref:HEPN domain-containing protein n=1 Tax=Mameliella alba TaxID=561184 RepID=UPI001430E45D|nr:HEPN domain-containing protein [Mameliella alba]